jgi:hypothetical protein
MLPNDVSVHGIAGRVLMSVKLLDFDSNAPAQKKMRCILRHRQPYCNRHDALSERGLAALCRENALIGIGRWAA